MADVSFTCRGYNYGLIGELEYELNRKIGPVEFLVINLPSDPNPVAHFIRVDTTSERTATLTWDGGSPVDGTYLMSLYVVNREGTMSDAMTLEVIVDRTAPVVFISKLLGASVSPSPVNRIHTPTASLTDTAVATISSIYEGDVKPHTFSLINSYKSSRKYTIDSSTGEIFYDTTKDVISLLTVDRDDITVDSDEISCDATLLETAGIAAVPASLNIANLDGVNDAFSAADSIDLDPLDGDFTVSIWFKTSTNTLMALYNKGDASVSYWDIFMNLGVIEMRADDGPNNRHYRTVNTFDDGNWHHLVARYNNYDAFLITVDDVAQSLTAVSTGTIGTINTTDDLQIGKWFGLTNFNFDGELCFGTIFDTTLSDSQITALRNSGDPLCYENSGSLKDNMTAFWDLANWTDHTLQEITDQTGNGNDLTNIDSTPFTGSGLDVECGSGAALPLDGTVHEIGYQVTDSRDTYSGTAKFVYKDTTFTGGIV